MEKNLGQDLMELRWVNHQRKVERLKICLCHVCMHWKWFLSLQSTCISSIFIVFLWSWTQCLWLFSVQEKVYIPCPIHFNNIYFWLSFSFSLFFFFTPSSWESKTLQNTPSKRKNVPTSIMQRELNTALWKSKCAMFGYIEMYYCPHSPFPMLQYGT